MPGSAPHLLRRTRAVAALPVRFDAFEQRQAGLEGQLGELRDSLTAARGELAEARDSLTAARGELAEARAELADLRRLVEARVLAEAESTALVGKLLQRADARLEALERGNLSGGG